MKFLSSFRLALCLLLITVASYASEESSPAGNTALLVEVSGLQDAVGNIYIAVYDSDDTWLGEETVLQRQVVIAEARDNGLVSTQLHLPPGQYAISIYHDSNDNGELDTNFIGIPKEPVALSNNARPKFGPPKYEDAVFTLGETLITQRIAMEDL
ncbi:MAG: DUF2141 domain-containing protein [Halioglobus sp.]